MKKGRQLAKKYNLNVDQSLYSDWGNFYAPITKYPCALFDADGYIILDSKEMAESLGIKLGKRTNIPQRISSLESYQPYPTIKNRLSEEVDIKQFWEGSTEKVTINRYERDKNARNSCLDHYGYKCTVCNLVLSKKYGKVADNFIHVHHITPISQVNSRYHVDPIEDLRPVCPNCHAIIHLKIPPYTIEEVQQLIEETES